MTPKPKPVITKFHHASLIVADTEISLEFYHGILGLAVDPGRPDLGYPGAWLQLGEHQIHLLELPNPDQHRENPDHGGRDRHLALSIRDLAVLEEVLNRAGIDYTRSRSGRAALFCRDPDGNVLEFIQQG